MTTHDQEIEGLLPAVTASAEETAALGERLGRRLGRGDVVALFGDLGAGKTELTKGLCRAMGIQEESVSSPTFTLVREYHEGSMPVYHFDAYRIESLREMFDLGYDAYFFGDGISIVEWADRIEPLIPAHSIRILLRHAGDGRREISILNDK